MNFIKTNKWMGFGDCSRILFFFQTIFLQYITGTEVQSKTLPPSKSMQGRITIAIQCKNDIVTKFKKKKNRKYDGKEHFAYDFRYNINIFVAQERYDSFILTYSVMIRCILKRLQHNDFWIRSRGNDDNDVQVCLKGEGYNSIDRGNFTEKCLFFQEISNSADFKVITCTFQRPFFDRKKCKIRC